MITSINLSIETKAALRVIPIKSISISKARFMSETRFPLSGSIAIWILSMVVAPLLKAQDSSLNNENRSEVLFFEAERAADPSQAIELVNSALGHCKKAYIEDRDSHRMARYPVGKYIFDEYIGRDYARAARIIMEKDSKINVDEYVEAAFRFLSLAQDGGSYLAEFYIAALASYKEGIVSALGRAFKGDRYDQRGMQNLVHSFNGIGDHYRAYVLCQVDYLLCIKFEMDPLKISNDGTSERVRFQRILGNRAIQVGQFIDLIARADVEAKSTYEKLLDISKSRKGGL